METKYKIMLGAGAALIGTTAVVAYLKRGAIANVATNAAQAVTQEAKELIEETTGMKQSYFSIAELCASDTAKKYGIDNTPTPEVKQRLQLLIDNVLNPARRRLGKAIHVTSGYRCPALNKKVGGVSNSQHMTGMAADLVAGSGSAQDMNRLFEILVSLGNYDQLIWEHPKNSKWIHVSFNPSGGRLQVMDYNGKQYTDIRNNWQMYLA